MPYGIRNFRFRFRTDVMRTYPPAAGGGESYKHVTGYSMLKEVNEDSAAYFPPIAKREQ